MYMTECSNILHEFCERKTRKTVIVTYNLPVIYLLCHVPPIRHVQGSTPTGAFEGGCSVTHPILLFTFCSNWADWICECDGMYGLTAVTSWGNRLQVSLSVSLCAVYSWWRSTETREREREREPFRLSRCRTATTNQSRLQSSTTPSKRM